MKIALIGIVYWLSLNFGLPANYELPSVERVSADKMLALRYERLSVPRAAKVGSLRTSRNIVALYDSSQKIIYLSEDWSGRTPTEMSILVHEMVHVAEAERLRGGGGPQNTRPPTPR